MLWLPGQARASATRAWFAAGILPCLLVARLPRSPWLLPWAALAGLSLAATPWLRDPGGGPATFLVQLTWVAGLALGLRRPATAELAPWIAAAGAAAALPGLLWRGGTFGNPDFLAVFLVGTILWTAALLRPRDPVGGAGPPLSSATHGGPSFAPARWRRWLTAAVLALQIAALVRCDSLGAWLALGVGGWSALTAGRRVRWWLIPAAAVLLTLTSAGVREHLRGRAHLTQVSLTVIAEALPLGVGPGQLHGPFLDAQARRLAAHPTDASLWTNAYHAHNEPLQALAEQGLAGLLLLLLPVVAALWRRPADPAGHCVLAYATLGLITLPLYEPATAVLATLCVGLCLTQRTARPTRGEPVPSAALPPTPAPPAPRAIALAVATLALCLATAELLADRLLARGAARGEVVALRLAGTLALRPARAWQHTAEALVEVDPDAAWQLAHEAVQRNPSPVGWALAGRCADRAGRAVDAIAAYQEALRLNPRLFAGHFNLALIHEWRGDRHLARRHAERARALRPADRRLNQLPR